MFSNAKVCTEDNSFHRKVLFFFRLIWSTCGSKCNIDKWLCDWSEMFVDNKWNSIGEHSYIRQWLSTTNNAWSTSGMLNLKVD